MGWNPFSSKQVTTVGTSIVRLIDDKHITDSVKLGLVNGLAANGDVVDYILEASTNSLAIRAERAYKYGTTNAPYGMPAATFYSNDTGETEVTQVLETIEGGSVYIDYFQFGPLNLIHATWQLLVQNHGYDTTTNKLGYLSTEKQTDVYLQNIILSLTPGTYSSLSPEVMDCWGKPANSMGIPGIRMDHDLFYLAYNPAPINTNASTDTVLIKYTYVQNNLSVDESFEISLSSLAREGNYYQVKYYSNDVVKYWAYKYGQGTYSSLDVLLDTLGELHGTYFPNIYFRLAKQNLNVDTTTPQFKASVKYCKLLGLDYSSLVDQIGTNPGIGDVEQALMTVGVPAETTDPLELNYIFDYLSDQHNQLKTSRVFSIMDYMAYYDATYVFNRDSPYSVELKDTAFRMQFLHNGIQKKRVVGSIGNVGACTMSVETTTDTDTYFPVTCRVFKYKKQISLNFYEELALLNPTMKYYIYDGYNTIMGDQANELLLIPVDKALIKPYSVKDKERLLSRSLHLVFNSRVVTKVSWYQQSWFTSLLQIAAIVVTIISLGSDDGTFMTAVAAITAGAYATAAAIIFAGLVEYLVYTEGFKLFVKAVGVEAAFLLAIAAIAAGAYDQIKAGTVKLTSTAKEFLSLANGLMGGANAALKQEFNDLLGEFKELDQLNGEKTKALETANELLTPTQLLQPMVLLGETPDSYYQRTVHSGNIGAAAIDDVHDFYERSLTLPKYSYAIGE